MRCDKMNKLIDLDFIQKKKKISFKKAKEIRSVIEETSENHTYDKFKEKFLSRSELYNIDKKNKSEKLLYSIIKRIFTLDHKNEIIYLMNSIYNDGWDINNTAVTIIEDFAQSQKIEIAYDLAMVLQNEYKKTKYKIVLKVKDYDNLAIIIYREEDEHNINNVVSFFRNNKNKAENSEAGNNKNNTYIIMLNSNMLVPDVLDLTLNNNDMTFFYKFNILKCWKYDFKIMYEQKLYLLFPIKIFDLGKRICNMMYDFVDDEMINFEISRFFVEMNKYLNKLKEEGCVSQETIYKTNSICLEILSSMYEDVDISNISRKVLEEVCV